MTQPVLVDFIQTVGLTIGFVVAVGLVGKFSLAFLRTFEPHAPVQNLFAELLVGASLVISVYAIAVTRGHTLFLAALIIPLHFFVRNHKNGLGRWDTQTFRQKSLAPVLMVGIMVLFVACAYRYFWFYYDVDAGAYRIPNTDNYYYSTLGAMVRMMGLESAFSRCFAFDSAFDGSTPYHYWDVYPAAIMAGFAGMTTLKAYLCVVKPMFMFVSFVGFLAIFERQGVALSWRSLSLSVLALVFCGFFINQWYITQIWGNLGLWIQNGVNYKVEFYIPFVIGFFLAVSRQRLDIGVYCLVLLLIASLSFVPAVLCGIFGATAILIIAKRIKMSDALMALLPLMVFICFFVIFYAIDGLKLVSQTVSIDQIVERWSWRTSKAIVIDNAIKLALLYFPFALVAFLSLRSTRTFAKLLVLLFSIITICAGLAIWALNHYFPDAFQFSTSITALLLNVISFWLVVAAFKSDRHFFRGITVMIFIGCCLLSLYNFDEINFFKPKSGLVEQKFIQQVRARFNSSQVHKGLALANHVNGNSKTILMVHHMAGTSLPLAGDDFVTIPYFINMEVATVANDPEWNYQVSPFYSYAVKNHLTGNDALLDFVRTKGIEFLVLKKDMQVPLALMPWVEETIISEISDEVMAVLRPIETDGESH